MDTPSGDNVFDVLKMLREADVERAWRDAPENELQKNFVREWAKSCVAPKAMRERMDWFSRLTGFAERNHADVHRLISISGSTLTSTRSNVSYQCGRLELASLGTLRERIAGLPSSGKLRVAELVGDAKALHAVAANAGAVFQVASQFNLLEMVSPNVTPEHGVTIYENDPTQGPACAIACGAGTIYRNYFVELDGQVGQTAGRQVDCLADIGAALGNTSPHPQPLSFQEPAAQEGRGERKGRLWEMRNGYALPSQHGWPK